MPIGGEVRETMARVSSQTFPHVSKGLTCGLGQMAAISNHTVFSNPANQLLQTPEQSTSGRQSLSAQHSSKQVGRQVVGRVTGMAVRRTQAMCQHYRLAILEELALPDTDQEQTLKSSPQVTSGL